MPMMLYIFLQLKSNKLRFLWWGGVVQHLLGTVLLYRVGINRAAVLVEAVQF